MKARLLIASLLGWSMASSALAGGQQHDSMVVFGDSLSDPGNFYQLFGDKEMRPFEPENIPDAPYVRGGFRFSNGATWIEQLTRRLHIRPSGAPAARAPTVFTNYAVGRSRARNTLLDGVFSDETLTSQVDRFLQDFSGSIPTDATYTLWIGSNDVSDALGAFLLGDAVTGEAIITAAVTNTATELGRLYLAGARNFLVVSVPDFSITPRVRLLARESCAALPEPAQPACEQQIRSEVSMVSGAYNWALNQALAALPPDPTLSVRTLDFSPLLHDVLANPQAYGLQNVTGACTVPETLRGAVCRKPHTYLFWDGQHPTRAGHRILAQYARQQLAP